jgi:hypothetical protein
VSGSAAALGALAQSFTTADNSLVAGTIVSLTSKTANVVQKATPGRAPLLLGVTADQPLVALGGGQQQAQVVVSGLTPALVSNINGDIKIGDKVAVSPLEGIGMKAVASAETVGTAESNLSGSQTTIRTVTDNSGKKVQVKVGLVSVQVDVSYSAAAGSELDSFVPAFLVSVGSSIAGKDISPLRVLIGFCSLLFGFVVAGVMLQAGVRAGIISLGRNPLASGILRRSLLDVLVTSLGLLAISAIVFYLILTS